MKINCFIPFTKEEQIEKIVSQLQQSAFVSQIFLLTTTDITAKINANILRVNNLTSSDTIRKIAEHSNTEFSLIYTQNSGLELSEYALERFRQIAQNTGAGLVYADYYTEQDGVLSPNPVIDYQRGSLRDDFDFGTLLFYDAKRLKQAVLETIDNYQFAGLYNLRLKVSQRAELFHINEYLYSRRKCRKAI